jgi:hypothetical protein
MGAGERNLWRVFSSLCRELFDARSCYKAREWVITAATRIWQEQGRTPGEPIWINNPNEQASEESPVAQTLARQRLVIDEAAVADELDPAELRRRILLFKVRPRSSSRVLLQATPVGLA